MFGSRPNLAGLRLFGCKAFVYVEPRYRKKLEAKAVEGVFLVYAANTNAYVAAVPNNLGGMRLVQTRSITFDEGQPFFKEPTDKFDYVESGDRDDSGGYDSNDDGADGVAEPLVLPGPILPCADGDGGKKTVVRWYKELTMCNRRCCKSSSRNNRCSDQWSNRSSQQHDVVE